MIFIIGRTRGVAVYMIGRMRTFGLFWLVACSGAAPAPQQSFSVDGNTVRINQSAPGPMRFETSAVRADVPFPSAPVPGRVTVVEAKMAPSYAPLEGRIERVAVTLGDRVTQGQR